MAEIDRDDLLGDLNISDEELIESLKELDAGLDSEPTDPLEVGEIESIRPQLDSTVSEKPTLRELMRAKRAEIDGGVAISDDDPLVIDKRKAARALKKVGRTLNDLPWGWDRLPRYAAPGQRSRTNELHRVIEEGRKEIREAERLRELASGGRPANYDRLSVDEKQRVDARIRQQRHRNKKRIPSVSPTVAPLPLAHIQPHSARSRLKDMSRWLKSWAASGETPLARQLRKPGHQAALIRAAVAYNWYFNRWDQAPSHAMLAKGLRCSKDQARRRLDVLKSLYAPGGPWTKA